MQPLNESSSLMLAAEQPWRNNYLALLLLCIPVFTVIGNGMVILAVVRNQHLHTAINYFIVGLAVADMLVAVFVMPFAVYVEFNNGTWELGKTACDLYCASDVTCSTASILLLTVISFDRYRAVSHPIAYSQSTHNIGRVWAIMAGVWGISLITASPMVFGLNYHNLTDTPSKVVAWRNNSGPLPLIRQFPTADECRFNNPMYSVFSSVISFGIPLIIVLFVYMRIVLELRKRAQAARARRATRRYKKANVPVERVRDDSASKPVEVASNISVSGAPTAEQLDDEDEDEEGSSVLLDDDGIPLSQLMQQVANTTTNHRSSSEQPTTKHTTLYVTECLAASTTQQTASMCDSVDESVNGSVNKPFDRSKLQARSMPRQPEPPPARSQSMATDDPATADTAANRARFNTVGTMEPTATNSEGAMVSRVMANMMMPTKFSLARQFGQFKFPSAGNMVAKRERAQKKMAAKKERKATKTLGVVVEHSLAAMPVFRRRHQLQSLQMVNRTLSCVLMIFLVCWVPFFWLNVQNAVCHILNVEACQVDFVLFFLSTWLGYLNSTVNPIIYTVFNIEFRRAFRDIITCS